MAEEDAEARARKAKRKHEFETHESASSQQHTLGYISCPRCKESLHPSVKVSIADRRFEFRYRIQFFPKALLPPPPCNKTDITCSPEGNMRGL